ncbi:hypothetical protein KEM54_002886 [Ascosphaera aggregata]|nr:hypothetical protein KEM54_002886 [Ascosphaera aggregata]
MEPGISAAPPPLDEELIERLLGDCSLDEPCEQPYPATTRVADGIINGVSTTAMCLEFADRILLTISQNGKLGQWFTVPLENWNPGTDGLHTLLDPTADNALLPLPQLTATTMLGARGTEREVLGQLLASQLGSAIIMKTPNEKRSLILGFGLERIEADPVKVTAVIDLALRCL